MIAGGLFGWALVLGLCCGHGLDASVASLTYENEPNMAHTVFSRWLHHEDRWYLIPIYNIEGEAVVRVWPKNGPIEEFGRTTAKIGVRYLSGAAVDSKGDLAVRGFLKTAVYRLSASRPSEGFTLVAAAPNLPDAFVFWDDQHIVGGSTRQQLVCLEGTVPQLDVLNRQIPDGAHPTLGRVNHQRMVLARREGVLAVSFSLTDEVVCFDMESGRPVGRGTARFPGYVAPPDSYIKTFTPAADHAYISSFHRLEALSWFGERLFGFYQKGFESHGVWVCLTGDPFVYDNDTHDAKIQAIATGDVVLGKPEYEDDEVVRWDYWRVPALP